MVDKFVKVVVTDSEGKEFSAATTSPVQNDASADVSIIDAFGLRSDGTGIIGDRLKVSYGVTFGTPTAITWYKDGSVLTTWGNGNGDLNKDGALWFDVDAADGTGTYKATVVSEGKTYETNEIVITNKEEAAKITAFTIEDDYTDGKKITYGTDDNTAVVTVTLNKNYLGQFEIYRANDSKYSDRQNYFKTDVDVATNSAKTYVTADGGGTDVNTVGDKASVLTTDAATNFQVVNLKGANNSALGHVNADGSVTYKLFAKDGTLTRGDKYVIAFDQNSVLTDKPGQGAENVFGEAAEVPFVIAPAKATVTKVATANKPEVTFQNENGETLTWFGEANNQLSLSGISKGDIYYATEKTNDTTKAKALGTAIDTAGNVKKGVWTANKDAGTDAYWFAQVETQKGVFAKDSVKLTSEAVQIAKGAADMINLREKGTDSVDNAKTATVEFKNLRASGKVYVVRGKEAGDGVAEIYKYYTDGKSEQISASADVEAGASSVDIANAIDAYSTPAGKNKYIAVFVPSDTANYGTVYTEDGVLNSWKLHVDNTDADTKKATEEDSQGLTVIQKATTLNWDKNTKGTAQIDVSGTNAVVTITGKTLLAKDQFGEAMATNEAVSEAAAMTPVDKTLTKTEKGTFTYETKDINIDTTAKRLEVKLNVANKFIDKKDGFKFTLLGKEVEVTATNVAADSTLVADTGTTAGANSQLTIKIGGDTFCDTTAAEAANLAAAQTELSGWLTTALAKKATTLGDPTTHMTLSRSAKAATIGGAQAADIINEADGAVAASNGAIDVEDVTVTVGGATVSTTIKVTCVADVTAEATHTFDVEEVTE